MAGKIVSGAGAGTALGASLGSVLPGLGTAIGGLVGAAGGAVVGVFEGVFSSKKHYDLYYWETADSTWKFVTQAHPSQLRPIEAQYKASGLVTQRLRAKDGKSLPPPTTPPAGYSSAATGSKQNFLLIGGIVLAFGLVYFFIKRKK